MKISLLFFFVEDVRATLGLHQCLPKAVESGFTTDPTATVLIRCKNLLECVRIAAVEARFHSLSARLEVGVLPKPIRSITGLT